MKLKLRELFLISTTSIFLFFVFGNTYSYFRLRQLKSTAYRSNDKYSLPNKSKYMANIDSQEINLFGDLCSMGGLSLNCYFSEGKRSHRFKTDSNGYKTLANLNNSELAIIGDSFLAASGGDDMDQQFGSVLERLSKKKIYEAAHPGDIKEYNRRHSILKKKKPDLKFIYLFFEGNDFVGKDTIKYPRTKSWHALRPYYLPIYNQIKKTPIYKLYLSTSEAKKARSNYEPRWLVKVFPLTNTNKNKAFFLPYIRVSNQEDIRIAKEEYDYIKKNKESICGIVFAPTAYTTYFGKKTTNKRHPLLYGQLESLSKEGIQIVDLTIPLQEAAKLEHKNIPIWWNDDTHWNFAGINIAANKAFEALSCLKF